MARLLRPRYESVASAIARAELRLDPYPHFFADGVVSTRDLRLIRWAWPGRRHFTPEPGMIDRRWLDVPKFESKFWRDFCDRASNLIVTATFQKFAPWVAIKLRRSECDVRVAQLSFMEAGSEFEVHGQHSHYTYSPDFLFTMLLNIEDDGRTDRGTTLFKARGVSQHTYFDAAIQGLPLEPAVIGEFHPGALIAWLDGPLSFHGSNVGVPTGSRRGRRQLRWHVSLPYEASQALYGAAALNKEFMAACDAYRRDRDPAVFGPFQPGVDNDRAMAMAADIPSAAITLRDIV